MSNIYWKDKIFVSKGTITGFIIFGLVLLFIVINELLALIQVTERVIAMLSGISLILFMLGFIIDQLMSSNFNFWAFGALVSFLGITFFFSPVILYGLGDDDLILWIILVLFGIFLVIFGYGIEATEINKKFAKALISLWNSIKSYDWKGIPVTVLYLVFFFVSGFILYIFKGLKNLRKITIESFNKLFVFLKKSLIRVYELITDLPRMIVKTFESLYKLSPWFIIPASIIIGLKFSAPSDVGFISLIFVAFIYFSTIFVYKKREQISIITEQISSLTFNGLLETKKKVALVKQKLGIYKCPQCFSKIILTSKTCSNCNTDLKVCSICKLPIQNNNMISNCKECSHSFHQNHYDQWIRLNKVCPVCRVSI
ncbi:MAG: hypothetical protein HeimC3_49330 [Candidatus Heimdallarchaeota archaeon LC_3]|nr:MAG: hypothetical protein HeimC3_49330 [Candidatus Heimdallarchaeota archaeon LC_3]